MIAAFVFSVSGLVFWVSDHSVLVGIKPLSLIDGETETYSSTHIWSPDLHIHVHTETHVSTSALRFEQWRF